MKSLSLQQVLSLHQRIIQQSGGSDGVRDRTIIEAALQQCELTFDGQELYPTLHQKAAAVGYAL